MSLNYDKIPELLIDRSTILETKHPKYLPIHHTQFTYLFCILVRILIGVLIIQNKIPNNIIIIFSIIVLIIFGSKYHNIVKNKTNLWKNYQRHILTYITVLLFQNNKNIYNKNTLSGLLIIIDALMGQQSRFITTNMSRVAPN